MEILYGVKKVVLEELDPTTQLPKDNGGIKCSVSTGKNAELSPVISAGEEKPLRTDDKILAVVRTPDLLYGYDLKFIDNTFDVSVASLIEGGVIENEEEEIVSYKSPMMSEGYTNKAFRATVYVANYEGTRIKNYAKIVLNNCSGTAAGFKASNEFFAPEFTVYAREATLANLPIREIGFVTSLPA